MSLVVQMVADFPCREARVWGVVPEGDDMDSNKKAQGHDTMKVMVDMAGGGVQTGPNQFQTMELVFGERPLKGGGMQLVATIDAEGGIDIYPLISRFHPIVGKKHVCRVVFKDQRGTGRKIGYGFPVTLTKCENGEWLSPTDNIRPFTPRKARKRAGEEERRPGDVGYFTAAEGGPNGKIVLSGKGLEVEEGVTCFTQQVEKMGCFIATVVIPQETAEEMQQQASQNPNALITQADALQLLMDAVDPYLIRWGGRLFDVCEKVGVEKEATKKEIEKAYRALSREEHPDVKLRDYKSSMKQLGIESDPDEMTSVEWADAWSLITACKDRLVLLATRKEYMGRYLQAGRPEYGGIHTRADRVARWIGIKYSQLRDFLAKAGYPISNAASRLAPEVIRLADGYFRSVELVDKVEPTSTPSEEGNGENASEPEAVPVS